MVIHATRDFTVKTVQKAADLAVQAGSRLYTRRVKKLMRPRTCSISGAHRAVRGTGWGLHALRLD
jgi:hypothetical protein